MNRSSAVLAAASLIFLLHVGCCATPIALAAKGTKGAYARAVPADGQAPAQARAGLIDIPEHWPPSRVLHDSCTKGVDEVRELEQSLGASLAPITCPLIQNAPVPTVG